MAYEYAVVPAPKKGVKARGVKTPEDRFANALQTIMNEKGAEGWDYVRTDTLPSEERQGLTGRTTVFQNMMVFRRALAAPESAAQTTAPVMLAAPTADADAAPAALAAHEQDKMMNLDAKPLADDPARPEPKLSAD